MVWDEPGAWRRSKSPTLHSSGGQGLISKNPTTPTSYSDSGVLYVFPNSPPIPISAKSDGCYGMDCHASFLLICCIRLLFEYWTQPDRRGNNVNLSHNRSQTLFLPSNSFSTRQMQTLREAAATGQFSCDLPWWFAGNKLPTRAIGVLPPPRSSSRPSPTRDCVSVRTIGKSSNGR